MCSILNRTVTVFFLGLFLISSGHLFADPGELPENLRREVMNRFPGSTITEISYEIWQGKRVIEVELLSADGTRYELFFSRSGELIKLEKEDGLPLLGGDLRLGIAGRFERDPYKGTRGEYELVPFLDYENGPLEIRAYDGLELSVQMTEIWNCSVSLVSTVSLEPGYDPDDAHELKGMNELHTLFGSGLEIRMDRNGVEYSLEFLQELSGEHSGHELEFQIAYPIVFADCHIDPGISFTWLSNKTVEYFYGVDFIEATDTRPEYHPTADYELELAVRLTKNLWKNLSAVALLEFETFGAEITDSPLIDSDQEFSAVGGLIYSF